jgi:D-glycero-alpha-D-manno-heptose 1-phosphate guanylyltransferase
MAPVAGRPFITYLLDQLADAGFRQVVLLTGYMQEKVRGWLGASYHGLQLHYSVEEQPLGTGGAILQALPLIASETFLALNGDSYTQANFSASLTAHRENRAKGTLHLSRVQDAGRYGQVVTDTSGQILSFSEKGAHSGNGWINSGVYWFQRAALSSFTAQKPLSLERDILPRWVGNGLYGFSQPGSFLDIGVPEDYAQANVFLQQAACCCNLN